MVEPFAKGSVIIISDLAVNKQSIFPDTIVKRK